MASKADIIDHVSDATDTTKADAGKAVEAVFSCITEKLGDGDKVQIAGFGTFQISERSERQGRNPQTGASITIPASKGVRFKAGKNLKETVNG